jgi:hypothetical protein
MDPTLTQLNLVHHFTQHFSKSPFNTLFSSHMTCDFEIFYHYLLIGICYLSETFYTQIMKILFI